MRGRVGCSCKQQQLSRWQALGQALRKKGQVTCSLQPSPPACIHTEPPSCQPKRAHQSLNAHGTWARPPRLSQQDLAAAQAQTPHTTASMKPCMCLLSPVSSAHCSPAGAPLGRLLQPGSFHHAEGNCQRRDSCPSADGSTASEALEEVKRQLASRMFTGALLPWAKHSVRATRDDVTVVQVAPGWQKDVKKTKKPMRKKKKKRGAAWLQLPGTQREQTQETRCMSGGLQQEAFLLAGSSGGIA